MIEENFQRTITNRKQNTWSYNLEKMNNDLSLTLLCDDKTYSSFRAKVDCDSNIIIVKKTLEYLFDISNGIVEQSETCELVDFLQVIHEIIYDMHNLLLLPNTNNTVSGTCK